jgi:hypothetical protein
MQEHDPIEERMRTEALAPADEAFTRRVLAGLPPRRQVRSRVGRRSFALSMRAGLALAVVVGAQRWLASKPGDVESRLCGPWIPPSIQRLVWRAGRDWR